MKAIVNTGANRLELLERPMPEPGRGQVRIRTAACAICATDLLMIAGWGRTPFGCVPGHEWSGVVDAAGDGADQRLVGRKCVAENVLAGGGEVGFEHPGGYGQYFVTDAANVRVLPDGFDLTTAVLIEPLAVCVRGLSRLRADAEGPAIIFGDGAIGLLSLMLLKSGERTEGRGERGEGRPITLVGGRDFRLDLARQCGAASVVNYHKGSWQGLGPFRTLIEASGSAAAMDGCIDLAAPQARVLVIGDYGPARASFEWNRVLHRELEIIGSNASAGAWDSAVALATSGRLPLVRLITHVLPVERFAEGVELMRGRKDGVIKVVLVW